MGHRHDRRWAGRPSSGRPSTTAHLLLLSLLSAAAVLVAGIAPALTPADTTTVEGWLRRMTLEEKVAQMNYVPIGSVLVDPETVCFCEMSALDLI